MLAVKGKACPVVVHEFLGDVDAARPRWLDDFEATLAAWNLGDFDSGRTIFTAADTLRKDGDGPSRFDLHRLPTATSSPHWIRVVELESK